MNVQQQLFFHVSNQLDWQKDGTYFIGKEDAAHYQSLMNQEFYLTDENGEDVPMDEITEGMFDFVCHQEKPGYMPKNYHYDPTKTIREVAPMIHFQLNLIRELIFEEVRKEYFPQQLSRYKTIQVIPPEKGALSFWLPSLKKPSAKIYKLELTGKIHRANHELLYASSLAPEDIKFNAYQYWLGSDDTTNLHDEYIFEGLARVVEIIDGTSVKK